jgi:hypothetical protein
VPIDTQTPQSPGWWMMRLARKLADRQPRLDDLHARYIGDPPLPEGAENMRDAYRAFQKKARTNFAELIVDACRHRMQPVGFRTAVDSDDGGDQEAARIWEANDLDVEFADVLSNMLSMGDAYMIVGGPDSAIGAPVVTGEDPRQVVTIHNPVRQREVRAALKMFHDPEEERDLAYLYLPGEVWVASRPVRRVSKSAAVRFNAAAWEWDAELTAGLPYPVVPVVRFRNKRGAGEYESHTDLLDRINHQILQRMVIATMQAFRQRAIKNAPQEDEDGNPIDYDDILSADPGAAWLFPWGGKDVPPIELWESGQVDLTPILSAVKDDVHHLAAVTSTPLHLFSPDAARGSAEGASLSREALVFKTEDRIQRATGGLKDVMSLAFTFNGDTERADRTAMRVLWAPAERRSLSERADAAVKSQDMPFRARMAHIWGFSPTEIDEMQSDRAVDAMLAVPSVTVTDAPAV